MIVDRRTLGFGCFAVVIASMRFPAASQAEDGVGYRGFPLMQCHEYNQMLVEKKSNLQTFVKMNSAMVHGFQGFAAGVNSTSQINGVALFDLSKWTEEEIAVQSRIFCLANPDWEIFEVYQAMLMQGEFFLPNQ